MTTWVLLRGLMRDQRHWHGFDQRLRLKGLRVLTPDLPGNGRLTHIKSPLNIADYAAAVWQQIDEYCCETEPLYLLGLSMGGMLAMEMARQRPWQIKQVFILNSSAANLSPWYQRFNLINALKAVFLRKKGKDLNPIESTIVRLTSFRHCNDRHLIVHWSQLRKTSCPSLSNTWRQLWAAFIYQCPSTLFVPVSILCGDRDALVSIESSRALARHFQTALIVLAYCGHDAAIDVPAKLTHYLLALAPSVALPKSTLLAETSINNVHILDEELRQKETGLLAWDKKALSNVECE
ncbi:alpha/beta hydrolase [Shewanella sp. CG12_big_fil_rev_8_21_14_0_65_47_15]|uniref:alpha/beta fold hydrolase n=1 Tax=Shewanella sp. CG12_big_fil_rev_8_21_14_0_65_47_15 TaxID=1975537 RepID=UPI000CB7FB4F|nr:alpha/beta hydrolase [Shewanella sp. CG12_big_fil_rev_8_21_14_0_65_47_15]PIW59131.1 MAG: alpha/beta hydrolase [Shewanella sp. CG12_big_fil_rev_8_21_14_0_65_47_15]